eukprot:403349512
MMQQDIEMIHCENIDWKEPYKQSKSQRASQLQNASTDSVENRLYHDKKLKSKQSSIIQDDEKISNSILLKKIIRHKTILGQMKSRLLQLKDFFLKRNFLPTLKFFILFSTRDIKRHQCQYMLSFCSVFIIILSSILVYSMTEKGPVIFMKLAEEMHGEIDVYLTPAKHPILNEDDNLFLQESRDLSLKHVNKFESDEDEEIPLPSDNELQKSNQQNTYNMLPSLYTCLNIIDTNQEKKINLGTEYDYPKLNYGKCYITLQEAELLDLEIGDTLKISFKIEQLYNQLIVKYNSYAQERGFQKMYNQTIFYDNTVIPCVIQDFLHSTGGKFGSAKSDNHIIFEYDQFLPLISNYLPSPIKHNDHFREYVQRIANLTEYSDYLVMTLPSPRYKWYSSDQYDQTQQKITNYVNTFLNQTGFYPLKPKFFILDQMQIYSYGILMFNLIFNMIITVFMMMTGNLLNSLLTIGIERKSFDIGVIRMVGESKIGIIVMTIIQAFMFSLPALILAILISIPIMIILYTQIFEQSLNNGFEQFPSQQALIQCVMIGTVMPVVSVASPVLKLLVMYIEIIQKNRANLVPYLTFGLISVVYGINVYYRLPKALLTEDFNEMLNVFFIILIGLFIGLTILANNLQGYLELFLIKICLFWERKSTLRMLKSNFKAHFQNNSQTSRLYALSLGFILFLLGSYKLLSMQNNAANEKRWGNKPSFYTSNYYAIQPKRIEPILAKNMDIIETFTFIAFDINSIFYIQRTQTSDPGKLKRFTVNTVGVTPSIFNGTSWTDLSFGYQQTSLTTAHDLYTARGSQSAIISTYMGSELGVNPTLQSYSNYFVLNLQHTHQSKKKSELYRLRPSTLLSNSPYFYMNDVFEDSTERVLISIPLYAQMQGLGTIREVQYNQLSIKLKSYVSQEEEDTLVQELTKVLDMTVVQVHTNHVKNENYDTTLEWIFNILIIIIMFLCFFSLSSSMSANMYNQSKEIGVMRAIGLTKFRIHILYIYEAFILVLAASILGLLIGMSLVYTILISYDVQYKTGVKFYFPQSQMLMIVIFSVIVAFLSVYTPNKQILNKNISQILRM